MISEGSRWSQKVVEDSRGCQNVLEVLEDLFLALNFRTGLICEIFLRILPPGKLANRMQRIENQIFVSNFFCPGDFCPIPMDSQ